MHQIPTNSAHTTAAFFLHSPSDTRSLSGSHTVCRSVHLYIETMHKNPKKVAASLQEIQSLIIFSVIQ